MDGAGFLEITLIAALQSAFSTHDRNGFFFLQVSKCRHPLKTLFSLWNQRDTFLHKMCVIYILNRPLLFSYYLEIIKVIPLGKKDTASICTNTSTKFILMILGTCQDSFQLQIKENQTSSGLYIKETLAVTPQGLQLGYRLLSWASVNIIPADTQSHGWKPPTHALCLNREKGGFRRNL